MVEIVCPEESDGTPLRKVIASPGPWHGPDRRLLNAEANINGPGTAPQQETRDQLEDSPSYRMGDAQRRFVHRPTTSGHAKPEYYTHVTEHHPPLGLRLPRFLPHPCTPRCHQSHQNSTKKPQTLLNPSSVVARTLIPFNSLDWRNALAHCRHNSSTPRNCEMTSKS